MGKNFVAFSFFFGLRQTIYPHDKLRRLVVGFLSLFFIISYQQPTLYRSRLFFAIRQIEGKIVIALLLYDIFKTKQFVPATFYDVTERKRGGGLLSAKLTDNSPLIRKGGGLLSTKLVDTSPPMDFEIVW